MTTIALKVTGPPREGGNDRRSPEAKPLFRGTGDIDYTCGHCGSVMAASMGPGQRVIVDTATCSACGAINEFPVELRQ